jgi:hypothetical protein
MSRVSCSKFFLFLQSPRLHRDHNIGMNVAISICGISNSRDVKFTRSRLCALNPIVGRQDSPCAHLLCDLGDRRMSSKLTGLHHKNTADLRHNGHVFDDSLRGAIVIPYSMRLSHKVGGTGA